MLDGTILDGLLDALVQGLERTGIAVVQPRRQGQYALLPEQLFQAGVDEGTLAHARLRIHHDEPLGHHKVGERPRLAPPAEEQPAREVVVAERRRAWVPAPELAGQGQRRRSRW